jgi:hypothetical protein
MFFLTVASATSAPQFQPLRHQRNFCHPVMNLFTEQTLPIVNRKHFFINILCIESFCSQKTHSRTLFFGNTLLKHGLHFDYWNQPLNMYMHAHLLPRLSWNWTVLLPSDTHRKPITFIKSVLLPFVTYLLTHPRIRFFAVFPSPSWLIPWLSLELHSYRLLQNLYLFTARQLKGPQLVSLSLRGGVAIVRFCPVSGLYSAE